MPLKHLLLKRLARRAPLKSPFLVLAFYVHNNKERSVAGLILGLLHEWNNRSLAIENLITYIQQDPDFLLPQSFFLLLSTHAFTPYVCIQQETGATLSVTRQRKAKSDQFPSKIEEFIEKDDQPAPSTTPPTKGIDLSRASITSRTAMSFVRGKGVVCRNYLFIVLVGSRMLLLL